MLGYELVLESFAINGKLYEPAEDQVFWQLSKIPHVMGIEWGYQRRYARFWLKSLSNLELMPGWPGSILLNLRVAVLALAVVFGMVLQGCSRIKVRILIGENHEDSDDFQGLYGWML